MRLAHPIAELALAPSPAQPYHTDDLLPHARPATPHLRLVPRTQAANAAGQAHTGHLLIVDDDPAARDFLSVFLRRRGFRVWVAATTAEAQAMIAHHMPDLVLLDLNLPKLSGPEFIRALRRKERTALLPIIIISARNLPHDIRNGLALGADDYITKPLELSVVEARINALLRRDARLRKALVSCPAPEPIFAAAFSQN